jgi:class 3 adenylate cyclase/tetratricopeptide (TPR) repeat protein
VTALFADIKGSMELIEDLDPEEARRLVDPALKLMIDAVHRYDGYIVQSTGDGIFALFGAPVAHEDHPQRALYAALRMQEDIKRHSDKLREHGEPPISIRVGINTGEVVVRTIRTGDEHTEYTPIGHSTSLASRLQTLASPGSIAISPTVRKLVEGYFTLKALGPARIKGVSESVEIFEVMGLGPLRTRLQRAAGRGLLKFVGREREVDALKHAAQLAMQRHGQIVAAVAEAGVGKSRLFYEFKVKNQSGWMVLEAFSISHGKASAYLPVIDLLCSYFKISDEDDDRSRREKVAGRLAILDPSLESTRPYVYALLGIVEDDEDSRRHWEQSFDRLDEYLHGVQAKDPLAQMDVQIRRRRTLDAIKRILLRESLNQPLMLIFEDLHWIDEETQALLDLLADSIGTSRILILVNYRPEYSHGWTNKTYYTQLRLDPLSRESAERLLTALVGDEASLKPLRDLIVQKTEGNPFFMEEIVQGLFEDGALKRNGTTGLTRPLETLKIPTTVQAVLASRIDRLSTTEKDLLQTLAVIGKEFGLSLVRAVTGKSDDELTPTLSALQVAEFLYEQPAVGEVEYTFKHALTQEVAYNSVLQERRKLLHERIGAATELQFADHLDDHLGELARHYSRSQDLTKAVDYMGRAAEQAGRRSAYSEAIANIDGALKLLAGLPESEQRDRDELRLRVTLGPALMAVKGFSSDETRHSCERACDLARRLDAPTALFAVLNFLWGFHYTRGDAKSVLAVSEELIAIAEQLNDPGMLKDAQRAMGGALAYTGDLVGARRHLEKGLSLGDSPRTWAKSANAGPDANMLCLTGLSEVLFLLGYPDQALKKAHQAIAVVDARTDPFSLAMALTLAAQMHNYRREPDNAVEIASRALALCDEYGYPFWMSVAKRILGWALTLQGQVKQGIELMEQEVARFTGTEADMVRYQNLLNIAEAYRMIGECERAAAILEEWQSARRKLALVGNDPFYHRLRGKILLETGADKEAEQEYLQSMTIGRARDDKCHELQGALALAPLLIKSGRRDEARSMLADIYGWFTEGFDTADLQDAKALLDELNA